MRTIEPMVMRAIRDALERNGEFSLVPYVAHPMEVCRLILDCGGSQIAACAAVLHESVGTGCMTLEEVSQRYGLEVASLVESVCQGEANCHDESTLLLCADQTDHLVRRSHMGLADSLARDINQLQLALLKLEPRAGQVLLEQLEGLALTPICSLHSEGRGSARKSKRRTSAA